MKEENGIKFDISGNYGYEKVCFFVCYRYLFFIFFEFYLSGKWGVDVYVFVWFYEFVDGEECEFDLFIWKCGNSICLV